MPNLKKIEGIGEALASKFEVAGIRTTDSLLKECATSKGRREVARKTGVSEKLILKYTNQADLFRIKGVGEEYADLLEASGVDTVPELGNRNPQNLYKKMSEVNAEKKLVRQGPSVKQVESWVGQAKSLPRAISY
jgi:predicted flap endonuclease-1-like 5' DNA nuclease